MIDYFNGQCHHNDRSNVQDIAEFDRGALQYVMHLLHVLGKNTRKSSLVSLIDLDILLNDI